MRLLLLSTCIGLCLYGLYCAFRMDEFIGTGHYWSNPWFYKAHAALFAVIVLRILAPAPAASKPEADKKEQNERT